jgi:hypothetical protein
MHAAKCCYVILYTALLCLVLDPTCVAACAVQVADTYLSIALQSTEELVASMARPHTAVTDAQLKVWCTVLNYYTDLMLLLRHALQTERKQCLLY